MYLVAVIKTAPKFKDPSKWIRKFQAKEVGPGLAMFDSDGLARAFVFTAERLRAQVVAFSLNGGDLGLVVARSQNQHKIFSDLLVRSFKYGAIYIHYPTARGAPLVVFPSRDALARFREYELRIVKSYCEYIETFEATPMRLRDRQMIRLAIAECLRNKLCRDILRKSGVEPKELEQSWSSALGIANG